MWCIADSLSWADIGVARVRVCLALLLLSLLLAAGGCSEHLFGVQSDVVFANLSSCRLIVNLDGWEAFTLGHDSRRAVDNVDSGRHVPEANDEAGHLVERRYIELRSGEEHYWRIDAWPPR
jgi:hypothetical protein